MNWFTESWNWTKNKTLEIASSDIARKVTKPASKAFKTIGKNKSKILWAFGSAASGATVALSGAITVAPFTGGLSLLAVPVAMFTGVIVGGSAGLMKGNKVDDKKTKEEKGELLSDFVKMIGKEIADCNVNLKLIEEKLNKTSEEEEFFEEIRSYKGLLVDWGKKILGEINEDYLIELGKGEKELEKKNGILKVLWDNIDKCNSSWSPFPEKMFEKDREDIECLLGEYKKIMEKEVESFEKIADHEISNQKEKAEFRQGLLSCNDKIAQVEVYNK